ncbi:T9SS type A sorting domain-containing protein [Lewinella cohaerens]|uniref:dioxygenase family protein n=1 Tax=Lewinella cohaerens TaxID=70995 RepID=UPI00036F1B84|nr:T9SS type A sorting domain-containing protein [Lewinella cohaerens]
MTKDRRTFLKNTALATLGLGLGSSAQAAPAGSKPSSLLTCDRTTLDYYGEGPFYTENPPMLEGNQLAEMDEPGERMIISGRVLNLSCSEFIPNTVIDVWHADNEGAYDNSGYKLRGFTRTNEQGFYLFETIKPGKYLNGSSFRPAHIHYKITPPGFPQLITQLYFAGDTSIPGDAAASITSGTYDATNRVIPLVANAEGVLEGTFDITIDGEGIAVGTSDLHLSTGMVYKVSPNPFTAELTIHYGVFKRAKVGLVVFDLAGRQVAVLEDSEKMPEKYYATWQPDSALPNGHYFVALKINDLQVHYLKVVKV